MLLGYYNKRRDRKNTHCTKYAIPARFPSPPYRTAQESLCTSSLHTLSSAGTGLPGPLTSRSYRNILCVLTVPNYFHLTASQQTPVVKPCLSPSEDLASHAGDHQNLYPRSSTAAHWSTELTSFDKNEFQLGSVTLLHYALPL